MLRVGRKECSVKPSEQLPGPNPKGRSARVDSVINTDDHRKYGGT